MQLWGHMAWMARTVAIILFIESVWSLAVMIDRYLYFSAARKQSREFAPKVAGALKDSKLEEAIKIADRNKKSHLAEVVTAGLQEFRASAGTATDETIASSGRALERAEAIVHAKLKRGLVGSGHHRLNRSVRRPVRHRRRHSARIRRRSPPRRPRASAQSPAVFLRLWSPRRSACSWPSPPLWRSTISPDASRLSTWRWTTPRANWSTTSSSRATSAKREAASARARIFAGRES